MLEVRREYGFQRDEAESRLYSAAPRDWLTTTSVNPGQAFLKWRSDSERSLYPGTAALLLSAAGILGLLLTKKNGGLIASGALLAGLGIAGSFGPAGPVVPVLKIVFPFVFSGIRAFTRFGCVAQIGFGLLAGAGCAVLLERARSRGARAVLAAALAVGIAADVRQTVRFGFRPELPHPPVEEFLARSDTGGPILHLPLYHSPGDVRWTFSSLAHFKPIVNGYASYVPRRNQELAATLASEKIPEATALSARGLARGHSRRPRARASPRPAPADDGARGGGPSGRRSRGAAPVRPPGRGRLGLLPSPRIGPPARPRRRRHGKGRGALSRARRSGAALRAIRRRAVPRVDRRARRRPGRPRRAEGARLEPDARGTAARSSRSGSTATGAPARPSRGRRARTSPPSCPRSGAARKPATRPDSRCCPATTAHTTSMSCSASADGRMRTISRAFEWAP